MEYGARSTNDASSNRSFVLHASFSVLRSPFSAHPFPLRAMTPSQSGGGVRLCWPMKTVRKSFA